MVRKYGRKMKNGRVKVKNGVVKVVGMEIEKNRIERRLENEK